MLRLIYTTVRDSLLQLIIPSIISQVNLDLVKDGIIDSGYVCEIRYHDAYFFARTDDDDREKFKVIKRTDSVYLTRTFNGYFDDYSNEFLGKLIETNYGYKFLSFFYGRTWTDEDDARIDIALKRPVKTITIGVFKDNRHFGNTYFGNIKFTPYFNPNMTENAFSVLYTLGFDRYNVLFVTLHEISHFKDYLAFKKLHPNETPQGQLRSEEETDQRAFEMLDKYFDKFEYVIRATSS